jgi:hypothetical protein
LVNDGFFDVLSGFSAADSVVSMFTFSQLTAAYILFTSFARTPRAFLFPTPEACCTFRLPSSPFCRTILLRVVALSNGGETTSFKGGVQPDPSFQSMCIEGNHFHVDIVNQIHRNLTLGSICSHQVQSVGRLAPRVVSHLTLLSKRCISKETLSMWYRE